MTEGSVTGDKVYVELRRKWAAGGEIIMFTNSIKHQLANTCDELFLHCHDYDHHSRCVVGRAVFRLFADEGVTLLNEVESGPGDSPLFVPAGQYHTWKAVAPGTVIECELPAEVQRYEGAET